MDGFKIKIKTWDNKGFQDVPANHIFLRYTPENVRMSQNRRPFPKEMNHLPTSTFLLHFRGAGVTCFQPHHFETFPSLKEEKTTVVSISSDVSTRVTSFNHISSLGPPFLVGTRPVGQAWSRWVAWIWLR